MDNHSAHKSKKTRAYLDDLGIAHRFQPPYSCTLNPCEHWWSVIKNSWAKNLSKLQVKYDAEAITDDIRMVV